MWDFPILPAWSRQKRIGFGTAFEGSGFSSTGAFGNQVSCQELVESPSDLLLGFWAPRPQARLGEGMHGPKGARKTNPLNGDEMASSGLQGHSADQIVSQKMQA